MPTLLVQDGVDLDDCRLISALMDIGIAKIRHGWIRIGRARGWRQAVQDETSGLAVGLKTGSRPCGMLLHRSKFHRSSLFRKSEGIQTTALLKLSLLIQRDEILRKIPPRLKLFDDLSIQGQVPRQPAVEIDLLFVLGYYWLSIVGIFQPRKAQRRMRRTMARNAGNEERITRILVDRISIRIFLNHVNGLTLGIFLHVPLRVFVRFRLRKHT